MANTVGFGSLAKDYSLDKVVFPEAKIFLGFWYIFEDCVKQVFPLMFDQ